MFGGAGAALVSAGALAVIIGTLPIIVIVMPRMMMALAEQWQLPPVLMTVHSRWRTPHVAILISRGLCFGLAVSSDPITALTIATSTRLVAIYPLLHCPRAAGGQARRARAAVQAAIPGPHCHRHGGAVPPVIGDRRP